MSDMQQILDSIEACKEEIALSEAVERLVKNKDFKKVVLKHYVEDEGARLIRISADPNLREEELVKVFTDIKAIGSLQLFLQNVHRQGEYRRQEMQIHEEELDRIRSESFENSDAIEE